MWEVGGEAQARFLVNVGGAMVPKALPEAWRQVGVQGLGNVDFSKVTWRMLQNIACEVQRHPVLRH